MPVVDVHTHLLPPELPAWKERFGYGGFIRMERVDGCRARMVRDDGRPFREVEEALWSPAARLDDCARTGVDVQVLSTVPVMFSYWSKPEDGAEVARFLNDHLASVVREHPDRFVGLGTLPMQEPRLAIRELERCVRDLGLAGVQIGTHVEGRNLDDPGTFDVLAAAADLGAAVFVHPWDMLGGERMAKYWMPWLVGMPAETALAICSLVFSGTLDRLPALRIGFAHGGGAFPGTFGRIAHGFEARPDLVAVDSPRHPREALGRFFVDSLVHDGAMLRVVLDLLGPDRVMLGSDYPFPLGEAEPGALVRATPGLGEDVRRKVLGDNALAFLGRSAAHLASTDVAAPRERREAGRP